MSRAPRCPRGRDGRIARAADPRVRIRRGRERAAALSEEAADRAPRGQALCALGGVVFARVPRADMRPCARIAAMGRPRGSGALRQRIHVQYFYLSLSSTSSLCARVRTSCASCIRCARSSAATRPRAPRSRFRPTSPPTGGAARDGYKKSAGCPMRRSRSQHSRVRRPHSPFFISARGARSLTTVPYPCRPAFNLVT